MLIPGYQRAIKFIRMFEFKMEMSILYPEINNPKVLTSDL